MAPRIRAKNWFFTWNNYPENVTDIISEKLQQLCQNENNEVVYRVHGFETAPTTGTPHVHGFIQFSNVVSNPLGKLWSGGNGQSVRWERAKKPQESITYCKKHGNFFEFGTFEQKQGKRSDLDKFYDAVKDAYDAGYNLDYAEIRKSHKSVVSAYPKYVRDVLEDFRVPPPVTEHVMYDWQQQLSLDLNRDADPRKVIFVVDTVGNKGKTWFAKYYMLLHKNVQYLRAGKTDNMAYMLKETTRVLFLDITRTKSEHIQYDFLESVKDGLVQSNKYESVMKHMTQNVHVVCLMNEMPDTKALSADRYDIRVLDSTTT